MFRTIRWTVLITALTASQILAQEQAAEPKGEEAKAPEPTVVIYTRLDEKQRAAKVKQMAERAIAFLRTQQSEKGDYKSQGDPGTTALITTGLLQHGVKMNDPIVANALKHLRMFVQPDGGIYRKGSLYRNYETCLAILCFSQANKNGEYDKVLDRAGKFVKEIQWDIGEETDPNDPAYGGAGYGKHGRPDMSNTQFMIDALHELGTGENTEAMQRALAFVSRSQNLDIGTNDTKFAKLNPDGGFYYTPAAGGSSQAGTNPNGGLRSYGSMTYAGLKSMLYAGVSQKDPRVKAAVAWLKQHYDLKENPGMGAAGLFYYYHTFAKALDAMGAKEFVDSDGKKHDWRSELIAELANRQRKDGSWLNEHDRWYESDPSLVSGYVLLALNYCK
ncbi:MAG: prenyltransferase/squalene oxidase repeat-containing protein [Planctomycetota bacterium]